MTHSGKELIRTVVLEGYVLRLFATNATDSRGQTILAYELLAPQGPRANVLFEGSDFAGSPLHADDSDETVRSLLTFLTLRPGDTDREYFDSYTPEQLDWANEHAEDLSIWAQDDGPPLVDAPEIEVSETYSAELDSQVFEAWLSQGGERPWKLLTRLDAQTAERDGLVRVALNYEPFESAGKTYWRAGRGTFGWYTIEIVGDILSHDEQNVWVEPMPYNERLALIGNRGGGAVRVALDKAYSEWQAKRSGRVVS